MKLVVQSRRNFLRGAAATLALPFLPSLRPAWAADTPPPAPKRLVFFFAPNGMHMPAFTPTTEGADFELPYMLEPLAPVRSYLNVISGLDNQAAIHQVAGDHARGTATFLTCAPLAEPQEAVFNGISVDQVAAQSAGNDAPFPSLQVGLEGGETAGSCDSGYSCAYVRAVSWAGPRTPLPKITDPKLLFDRLFAGADAYLTEASIARRRAMRKSVLDYVLEDATRLESRLSTTDRTKIDEYMTGVREIETRIDALEAVSCPVPGAPPEDLDFDGHVEAHNDLMALALHCDLTRVVTFMLGNGGSDRTYQFLGVSGAHHQLSHHQDDPDNFDKLMEIGRWEVEKFSTLAQRLAGFGQEDGSSLLDNTLMLFGSEIEDGNSHSHRDMPVLLVGGAGGVRGGRHLAFDRPVADLYLTLLQAFGAPQSSFGLDGTSPLALT